MNLKFAHCLAFGLVSAALSGATQAQELVVGIFGGSFADDSKTCHIASFEKKTGAKKRRQLQIHFDCVATYVVNEDVVCDVVYGIFYDLDYMMA